MLNFSDSTISNNAGTGVNSSGGINTGATATITNCLIANNSATSAVGGVSNGGTMLLANSTITGNIAHIPSGTINGAGVANYETSLTVLNCTIANNSFVETGGTGLGAGLFNSGTLTIYVSTISNNTGPGSADAGGGIYNTYSNLPCTIVDSTLAGNSAKTGGGIWAMTPITLTNDTLAGNTATTGGGIYDATAVTMYNTLVANNTATKGADIALSTSGPPTLDGLNDLVADGSTIGTTSIKDGINGNIVGHPANIGTLQYYGGPTQTLLLESTSLAINAGGGLTIVTTNGGINATATSFTVGNAAAIAVNAGSYLIQVDNEVMTVTNVNLSTNTQTVTGGAPMRPATTRPLPSSLLSIRREP